MSTTELYIPVAKMLPECITDKKCDHGKNRTERNDYEWQHDVRRVQNELEREGKLQRTGDIWSLNPFNGSSSEEENTFIDTLFINSEKGQLRQELASLSIKSPEIETFNGVRYKRDRITIAKLKKLRDYKCQICGKTISIKDGKFYAEGAHIVEKRKGGVELPDNIIILCPNHHKEFDLGNRGKITRRGHIIEFKLNGRNCRIDLTL